jgi:hypothetical protein
MNIPSNLAELTALFERLGARNPASWARSQIEEGFPQLQRFLFLRQAWSHIVAESDTGWMQQAIQRGELRPEEPFAGVGAALRRCLDQGVSAQDLNDIVRGKQAEFLFNLCYLLEDPMLGENGFDDLEWGLFQIDSDGNPIPPRIGSLHGSVLETDPTGREMRPLGA